MQQSSIHIVGAPLDLGAGRRGVDMGPSALRVAGLGRRIAELGYRVEDLGNVPVTQAESVGDGTAEDRRSRFLPQIASTCSKLADMVEKILQNGAAPFVMGGDHSIATGTVAGVAHHLRGRGEKLGLIWLDAHTDMNTPETTPSGNVHGMPLACCVGLGPAQLTGILGFSPKVEPRNVALIGTRDVDITERPAVKQTGVHAFTMRDIDERGMRAVMKEAMAIAINGTAGYHLSLDMDFVDPEHAPGVGTPVRGGVTYREAHLAMEMICDSCRMLSMEVVEVNPVIDEVNRTADLAVELVLSAMGKRIL